MKTQKELTDLFDAAADEFLVCFGYLSSPIYSESKLLVRMLNFYLDALVEMGWKEKNKSKFWNDFDNKEISRLLGKETT